MSGRPQVQVRWVDDAGWMMRCDQCWEWWPLGDPGEFWAPRRSLQRCIACWREDDRVRAAERRRNPAIAAEYRDRRRVEQAARRRDPLYALAEQKRQTMRRRAKREGMQRARATACA